MKMNLLKNIFIIATVCSLTRCAPTSMKFREPLSYYNYLHPEEFNYEMEDYIPMAIEKNDISRTISKDTTKAVHQNVYSSPIYYIRLPPQPYVFVPNVGYISQPPQPVSQFVNLPINLVANGRPSTIYQWAGNADDFSPPTFVSQKPSKSQHQSDATIHKLPGQFLFNGKPDDVFVLRDSYNSLYADALQNFYP